MSQRPAGSFEYLRNDVLTATPEQLQLMLFDGAIRFATRGREQLLEKSYEAMFESLDRAQRIVLEISEGLNRDANPAVVDQIRSLMTFVYRRLVEGVMQRDAGAIDESLRILRHQRETWALLAEKVRNTAAAPAAGPAARTRPQPAPAPADAEASRFVAEA